MAVNSTYRTLTASNAEGINSTTNYLSSSFENGTITGWSLFSTTLTSGQPTGSISAGAASLTLATTSTNPLSGAFSLQLASAGAATAGQGFISDVFTLNRGDLAKPLFSKYSYEVISGSTNLNFSGVLGSQSIGVYFYDVTASAWIQPSGFLGMNQGTGPGSASPISFQSSSTVGQQYRMAIVFLQASAGAMTINFDDFQFSRQVLVNGAAITDAIVYTPTIGGVTTSSLSAYYERLGDSIHIWGFGVTSTTSSASLSFSLPPGLSLDTSKISVQNNTSNPGMIVGMNACSGGTNADSFLVTAPATSTTAVYACGSFASSTMLTPSTSAILYNNGQPFSFDFTVPIAGWSSNVQMSNDTDTRVIAARYTGATATLTSSYSNVTFTTQVSDTNASYSGSTYTIPVSGFYDFGGQLYVSGTAALNATTIIGFSQNGSVISENDFTYAGAITGSVGIPFNFGSIKCNAGDLIVIQAKSSITLPVISASSTENFIQVKRLSGPSVIATSESVNCCYYTSSNFASTSAVQLNFDTKEFDSHNAVTTGAGVWKFTTPISGTYSISMTENLLAGTASEYFLYKNGTKYKIFWYNGANSGGSGTTLIRLNAGDALDVRCVGSTPTLVGGAIGTDNCQLAISRVGN